MHPHTIRTPTNRYRLEDRAISPCLLIIQTSCSTLSSPTTSFMRTQPAQFHPRPSLLCFPSEISQARTPENADAPGSWPLLPALCRGNHAAVVAAAGAAGRATGVVAAAVADVGVPVVGAAAAPSINDGISPRLTHRSISGCIGSVSRSESSP